MLDDNGIRPPVIAAGINLFGGPLGLLHRHVTGAIPIRRNTRDPVYLMTLKAYVAELLRKQRPLLLSRKAAAATAASSKCRRPACCTPRCRPSIRTWSIVPTAVAYDLVLEDHVLARQRVKRAQRPFSRELAEMVRYAVGYQSRAFVTFGDADSARRRRSELAPRGARPEPRGHDDDRPRLQSAADGARRRGHAAVDHATRAGAARRRAHRHAARPPAPTSA